MQPTQLRIKTYPPGARQPPKNPLEQTQVLNSSFGKLYNGRIEYPIRMFQKQDARQRATRRMSEAN